MHAMKIVSIHQAKTHFSKLIEAVSQGEEIVITRAGQPAAKLVSFQPAKFVRRPGSLKGKMTIADDFDAPLPDRVLAGFGGM
jgi:prevent-host-death family protein